MSISDEFYDALMDNGAGGGCTQECRCGRYHFASDGHWDWNEGELENLLEEQKKDPDKYIDNGESVRFFELEGGMLVYECPCNRLEKIEGWVWQNRDLISAYIHSRTKKQKEEIDKQWEAIKDVTPLLRKVAEGPVSLKKTFYANGSLKSIYYVNQREQRIGRQRDFLASGEELYDFVWGQGEFETVFRQVVGGKSRFDFDDSEVNYWHYLERLRGINVQS